MGQGLHIKSCVLTNEFFTQCKPFQKYHVIWILIFSKIYYCFPHTMKAKGLVWIRNINSKISTYFKLEMVLHSTSWWNTWLHDSPNCIFTYHFWYLIAWEFFFLLNLRRFYWYFFCFTAVVSSFFILQFLN